eukprot:IDg21781t1
MLSLRLSYPTTPFSHFSVWAMDYTLQELVVAGAADDPEFFLDSEFLQMQDLLSDSDSSENLDSDYDFSTPDEERGVTGDDDEIRRALSWVLTWDRMPFYFPPATMAVPHFLPAPVAVIRKLPLPPAAVGASQMTPDMQDNQADFEMSQRARARFEKGILKCQHEGCKFEGYEDMANSFACVPRQERIARIRLILFSVKAPASSESEMRPL